MAGVTDLPFRVVCKGFGAGLVYSEMVSAKALHYGDKKTAELLKTSDARRLSAFRFSAVTRLLWRRVRKGAFNGRKDC